MPKIGCKRSLKFPKGICDDWWKSDIHFSYSDNSGTVCVTREPLIDNNFYYLGFSYLDCNGCVSLPEEVLYVLDCKFGDFVLIYKSIDGIFIDPRHRQG